MRKVRIALAAALLGLALFALGGALADAAGPGPAGGPDSANANLGGDALVKTPDIRHGNQSLLFERYAGFDYTPLHVDPGSSIIDFVKSQEGEAANWQANQMASIATGFLILGAKILISLMEWAFSLDLVTASGGPLTTVVGTLRQQFYNNLQNVAVVGVGIFLIYVLLASRVIRAVTAVLWAIGAIALAGILMDSPLDYASTGNDFTNQASQMALGALSSADATGINRGATTSAGAGSDAQVRIFADRAWRLWAYQPWTVLEFGQLDPTVPGTNRLLGEELLDKKAGHQSNFDADFQKMPQSLKDFYNGDRGGDRLVLASLALIGLLGAFVLMLALTLSIFGFALGAEALWMLLPIVALVWPIPGFGRNLAIRWFGLLLGCYFGRFILSIYLGLVMILNGILSGFAAQVGWVIAVILQFALLWLAYQHRHTFLHLGRKVVQPVAPAPAGAQVVKQAQTRPVHENLNRVDRRLTAPLRRQSLGAGQRALPASGNGAAAGAKAVQGRVVSSTTATAGRAATAGAGQSAAVAGAGAATGGAALAGLALIRTGRLAARGYDRFRRGVQAQGGHLLGDGASSGGGMAHGPSSSPGFFTLAAKHIDHRRRQPMLQAQAEAERARLAQQRASQPPKRTKKLRLPKGEALSLNQSSTVRVIKPELEADRL